VKITKDEKQLPNAILRQIKCEDEERWVITKRKKRKTGTLELIFLLPKIGRVG
jgi:hypothetical protein